MPLKITERFAKKWSCLILTQKTKQLRSQKLVPESILAPSTIFQIGSRYQKKFYSTEWLFVLDADEYLMEPLEKIRKTISNTDMDAFIKRRFYWQGKWIKRGYYPTWLLRLGRAGMITCDERPINEHIICQSNKTGKLQEDFVDH